MRVSVLLYSWRPGGLDVTLPALATQSFKDFEIVFADELAPWRSREVDAYAQKLGLDFRSIHPDNSLFPVTSSGRAFNAALRVAKGELVVHLSDYSIPCSDFIEKHVAAQASGPAIGVSPYRMWTVDKRAWAVEGVWSPWSIITEMVSRGEKSSVHLSTFSPVRECYKYPATPGPRPQPESMDWILDPSLWPWRIWWKTDAAPLAALRAVNGWDQAYDGLHGSNDVDLNHRLIAYGLKPVPVDVEVPILDPHPVFPSLIQRWGQDNQGRLASIKVAREAAKTYRCRYGIETDMEVPA